VRAFMPEVLQNQSVCGTAVYAGKIACTDAGLKMSQDDRIRMSCHETQDEPRRVYQRWSRFLLERRTWACSCRQQARVAERPVSQHRKRRGLYCSTLLNNHESGQCHHTNLSKRCHVARDLLRQAPTMSVGGLRESKENRTV